MSSERFSYNDVKNALNEMGYDFPFHFIQINKNIFNGISEFTHDKLTLEEMIKAYNCLEGVLLGQRPDLAVEVPKEERIRIQTRVLDSIPETAGKLDDEEKKAFAFVVYHATCVQVFDPRIRQIKAGAEEFTSVTAIKKLYQEDREMNASRYAFDSRSAKAVSSSDFGYSSDNPVKVMSVGDAYQYLNVLTKGGKPVEYRRVGSCSGGSGIIDLYSVRASGSSEEYKIYIDPYGDHNSKEAPEGFELNIPGYRPTVQQGTKAEEKSGFLRKLFGRK